MMCVYDLCTLDFIQCNLQIIQYSTVALAPPSSAHEIEGLTNETAEMLIIHGFMADYKSTMASLIFSGPGLDLLKGACKKE